MGIVAYTIYIQGEKLNETFWGEKTEIILIIIAVEIRQNE